MEPSSIPIRESCGICPRWVCRMAPGTVVMVTLTPRVSVSCTSSPGPIGPRARVATSTGSRGAGGCGGRLRGT